MNSQQLDLIRTAMTACDILSNDIMYLLGDTENRGTVETHSNGVDVMYTHRNHVYSAVRLISRDSLHLVVESIENPYNSKTIIAYHEPNGYYGNIIDITRGISSSTIQHIFDNEGRSTDIDLLGSSESEIFQLSLLHNISPETFNDIRDAYKVFNEHKVTRSHRIICYNPFMKSLAKTPYIYTGESNADL